MYLTFVLNETTDEMRIKLWMIILNIRRNTDITIDLQISRLTITTFCPGIFIKMFPPASQIEILHPVLSTTLRDSSLKPFFVRRFTVGYRNFLSSRRTSSKKSNVFNTILVSYLLPLFTVPFRPMYWHSSHDDVSQGLSRNQTWFRSSHKPNCSLTLHDCYGERILESVI